VLAGTDGGYVYRVVVDSNLSSSTPLLVSENQSAPVITVQYAKVGQGRGNGTTTTITTGMIGQFLLLFSNNFVVKCIHNNALLPPLPPLTHSSLGFPPPNPPRPPPLTLTLTLTLRMSPTVSSRHQRTTPSGCGTRLTTPPLPVRV